MEDIISERYSDDKVIRTKRMLLLGAMLSIVMMFAALMSAYIVSRGGAAYWVNIKIPMALWISTILIMLSSVTAMMAVRAGDRKDSKMARLYLIITFLLGIGFAVSQYQGFLTLADRGLNFTGNVLENLKGEYGEDFFITNNKGQVVPFEDGHYIDPDDPLKSTYIDNKINKQSNAASTYFNFLIILHVLHVFGGLIYLAFLVIYSFFRDISSFNYLKVKQIATYWHFVDVLWIVLLLFLYFIH